MCFTGPGSLKNGVWVHWCSENGNPPPVWTQQAGSVFVTFKPVDAGFAKNEVTGEATGEVRRLFDVMIGEMKRQEIQDALGLKHEDHFREYYLIPALKAGLIEMTNPDKPKSSKQKYRLTGK